MAEGPGNSWEGRAASARRALYSEARSKTRRNGEGRPETGVGGEVGTRAAG